MGYDERQPSSSAGTIVAVILAVVLVIGLFALLAFGGVAYFSLSSARLGQQEAIEAERRAVAQAQQAKSMARKAESMAQANQQA